MNFHTSLVRVPSFKWYFTPAITLNIVRALLLDEFHIIRCTCLHVRQRKYPFELNVDFTRGKIHIIPFLPNAISIRATFKNKLVTFISCGRHQRFHFSTTKFINVMHNVMPLITSY